MSSGSPESSQDENAKADDAGSDASQKLPTSAGDIAQEGRSETPYLEQEAMRGGIRDDGLGHIMNEGALMGEVRSSLRAISNGVEELSATVQDLLGLSDSDSSDDYNYDMDGGRQFSWTKLKAHATSRRRRRKDLKHAPKDSQQTSSNDDTESDDEGRKPPKEIIPEVRVCNLTQFQSRRPGDGRKLNCVDVLVADDSLDSEIIDFEVMIESGKPVHISDLTESSIGEDHEKKWIRRIRINSRAVMEMLHHVCPELKGRRSPPAIFYRPFQLLVHLHKEVKERLTQIKEVATENSNGGTNVTDSKKVSDLPKSKTPGWDSYIQKLVENHHLLEQLTCFVDLMESRIMPDSCRYRPEQPPSTRPKTIRYEDLWYLFRPGDLVYINHDPAGPERLVSRTSAQRIIRVIQTSVTNTTGPRGALGLPHVEARWFILGHFIDYDGLSYVPIAYVSRHIVPFAGEIKVTELPIYPISYLEDDQIMAQAMLDGATYISLIERRSGFYSGWTQTANPFGIRLQQHPTKGALVSPEHVESDILVDFQETFNAFPDWRPIPYEASGDTVEDVEAVFHLGQSTLPQIEWDEDGQITHFIDHGLSRDETELVEAKKFLMEDALGQFRKQTRTAPTGEYLALLPRRFFAYAVLERKFVQLNTRFVRSANVEANDKAFKKLEIDHNYKRLILSLVKSHFDKIETEKKTNVEIETQDLIRGKGKGIVILLHGVPGVGKTATAEAVALKWKKPLFPITCGDLGYTAETLEKSLHEIFRLAHHWGCILLLDEADVFITQRERHDLKRNALVSAFLRVLEYYNGIMFLTTNRAGVLDEAIKSRVHLNLYYDHLTEEQTVAIFKQHIQRLREIEKQRNPDPNEQIWVDHKEIIQFARDHFNQRDNTHGSGSNFGRWNGRQIRNAFLIASSLAHYDSDDDGEDEDKDELAEPSRKKQKQLGRSQFEVVAKTTLMYDQYRATVHSGKSDDHVAFEREERAMSSQPRSPTPVRMKNIGRSLN